MATAAAPLPRFPLPGELPVLNASGAVVGYETPKKPRRGGGRKKKAVASPAKRGRGKRRGKAKKSGGVMARARQFFGGMRTARRVRRRAEVDASTARRRVRSASAVTTAAPAAPTAPTPKKARRSKGSGKRQKKSTAMTTAPASAPAKSRRGRKSDAPGSGIVRKTEKTFDSHRGVVRGVTIAAAAVGAVKLNARYPDGVTALGLEASTVAAAGTAGLAWAAKKLKMPRTASALVDVTVGAVVGTVVSGVATGKTPLLAKKA